MIRQRELETERLLLRRFAETDIPAIVELAGEREIAATTLRIPHPYTEKDARLWLDAQAGQLERDEAVHWAVTLRDGGGLVGAVGLMGISLEHGHAEMGFWIGRPFWNRGYGTEAAGAALDFAFDDLELGRVHAHHFAGNEGSGIILRKIGMRHEGTLRRHIRKWDRRHDVETYGILRDEWKSP